MPYPLEWPKSKGLTPLTIGKDMEPQGMAPRISFEKYWPALSGHVFQVEWNPPLLQGQAEDPSKAK